MRSPNSRDDNAAFITRVLTPSGLDGVSGPASHGSFGDPFELTQHECYRNGNVIDPPKAGPWFWRYPLDMTKGVPPAEVPISVELVRELLAEAGHRTLQRLCEE